MPAPKKRKTKSQKGKRRAHIKVEEQELTECPQCGEAKKPHTVCDNCGYYKGEQVIKQEQEEQEQQEQDQQQEEKDQDKTLSWENLSRS